MSFSFPSNPTVGQQSTQNGRVYAWTGAAWELVSVLETHAHGAITSDGRIGTASGKYIRTTTNGALYAADTVGGGELVIVANGASFSLSDNSFVAQFLEYLFDADTASARSQLSAAASSHSHGNITNAGAIGSSSGQLIVTGASGVLTTATIGSGLTLSGGTLTASGGGGGSSVGSDLYLWNTFR